MKIIITTNPQRKKPQVGDRKIIKGVLHERRLKYAKDFHGRIIGLDCTGGRQNYEWRPIIKTE